MALEQQTPAPLVEAEDVAVAFAVGGGLGRRARSLEVVHGVSVHVAAGETLGLVGESGSGKTTLGRALLGLVPLASGAVRFDGADLATLPRARMRELRREMQIVFQNPASNFDPLKRIAWSLAEPLRTHGERDAAERERRVGEALVRVGLEPGLAARYPHELSGGQLQRVAIARALVLDPRFVVCDEPTSALDVSAQAQIVNLLRDLQEELGLAYLFVSHDLAVVANVAHRVAVLYLGAIVESGPARAVFAAPRHPYTRALIASAPEPVVGAAAPPPLRGEMPDPLHPPAGCRFHTRCPLAVERCRQEIPRREPIGEGRDVACFRWREVEELDAIPVVERTEPDADS